MILLEIRTRTSYAYAKSTTQRKHRKPAGHEGRNYEYGTFFDLIFSLLSVLAAFFSLPSFSHYSYSEFNIVADVVGCSSEADCEFTHRTMHFSVLCVRHFLCRVLD